MRRMRRALRPAALAVLCLAVAGCGGSSREDYRRDLNDVGKVLRTAFAEVAEATATGADAKTVGAKLEESAAELDAAARDFAAVEPPREARSAHGKIVAGVREYARAIRAAASKAVEGGLTAVSRELRKIAGGPGAREIARAVAELKDAGYEFKK